VIGLGVGLGRIGRVQSAELVLALWLRCLSSFVFESPCLLDELGKRFHVFHLEHDIFELEILGSHFPKEGFSYVSICFAIINECSISSVGVSSPRSN
jgi:hypothetical protein